MKSLSGINGTFRIARAAGFTLVELLIALLLMAFISVGIIESLRFGQRSYERIRVGDESTWDVYATQQLIRKTLQSAYPQDNADGRGYGLEGTDTLLAVTARGPLAFQNTGLIRYQITAIARKGASGLDLVARWSANATTQDSDQSEVREEVLLKNIRSIEFEYEGRVQSLSGATSRWKTTWEEEPILPAGVKVNVQFNERDPRVWPELIVAPRITHGATCVFDVVGQDCRGHG